MRKHRGSLLMGLGERLGDGMNLNTATVEEMAPVVGLPRAYDLLLWRPYLSWEDVSLVPGIDDALLDRLKAAGADCALPGEPRSWREL